MTFPDTDRRSQATPAGFAARHLALGVMGALDRGRALDDALDEAFAKSRLEPRDKGFARALIMTALRRRGQIDDLIDAFVSKPLPRSAGATRAILRLMAAELVFMDVPAHAAVSQAVALAKDDSDAQAFKGLINAVGRRLAEEGQARAFAQDKARLNTQPKLWRGWVTAYGPDQARAIALAHLIEAPLDLTLKSEVADWPARLEADVLPNGSLRRAAGGRIEDLPGFAEGAWWVQDAAAQMVCQIIGPVAGQRILDLCAAPGGKTLALAAKGAQVTALDRSAPRLERLRDNLKRVGLSAEVVAADALIWRAKEPFATILLDAPCSATGTLRRHPDVGWSKREEDWASLIKLQDGLIEAALNQLQPGGRLIYATCSLEPEEGPERIKAALSRHKDLSLEPITPDEVFGQADLLSEGCLRTLPSHWKALGGLDGFFAARLRKRP